MAKELPTTIPEILKKYESEILTEWIKEQAAAFSFRPDLMHESELKHQSREFLNLITETIQTSSILDVTTPPWVKVREFLETISRSRALQGFTSSETASFVFSLKQPVFTKLQEVYKSDSQTLLNEIWALTALIDKLGLYTTEVFIASKESIISRQQREMVELSTPVVQLWSGILALPLIGTLDSERTQVVMESLLTKIVETGSYIAIIDITGVPTVDTLVAQHLLKTVAAAKLMGAECIISGIRPQIAQTIVHLGVDLSAVITKSSMADAFRIALQKHGLNITKLYVNTREA